MTPMQPFYCSWFLNILQTQRLVLFEDLSDSRCKLVLQLFGGHGKLPDLKSKGQGWWGIDVIIYSQQAIYHMLSTSL